MEVSITTISKNGQIVIPHDIRKALGIQVSEKFLVIGDGDTILIKRLRREVIKKEFEELVNSLSDSFAKAGITKEDVDKEIKAHRKEKRTSRAGSS